MKRPSLYLSTALAAALLGPGARAGFTYADLVALLNTKNIRSVEELTAALPPELQSGVTFRLKAHSRIQDGPRAIRFTPNGRLILTHNDRASKHGGRSVEVMEVLPSGDLRLHDITFSAAKKAPVLSSDSGEHEKRQLQSCIACHGDPPRLIWPAYNEWPDACGAKDDRADGPCLAFLKSARKNPRFKDLQWNAANPAWPYYGANPSDRAMMFMPNTRLTALVTYHDSRQMANVVEGSPLFPFLKYNLIRQNRCLSIAPPAALKDRLRKLLMRDSAIVPPANWSKTPAQYVEAIFANRDVSEYSGADISSVKLSYDRQNRLTYLELFGIPEGNTGGNEVLTKAGRTGSGFTGQEFGGDTTALMTVQLMNDLTRTDSQLKAFVAARSMKYSDSLVPNAYFDNRQFMRGLDPSFNDEYEGRLSKVIDSDNDLCGYLTEKAREELDAYERALETWPKNTARPIANVLNPVTLTALREIRSSLRGDKLRAGKLILEHEKCIACHDPNSGRAVGPLFPFRNARAFAKANLDTKKYGGTLLQRVKEAISSDTTLALRMPLNRPALSAEEREAVMAYLESMATGISPNPMFDR